MSPSSSNVIWLSFDVEATGPVPGLHSTLWSNPLPHVALHDAEEQANLLIQMLSDTRSRMDR